MTAEVLLLVLVLVGTALSAGIGALILAALGPGGWLVIVALGLAAALVVRLAARRLAAHATWARDDLRDEWRAG
ncbi:hypothetical protein [Amaricoccus sp.]|uniref:hypothetical protein n=1 Tax=Amaricoccus sp. TaxID=1872485 RepID=UPI001B732E06|nr:hypothetical protein [Amaricoccus sp.]MBP7242671.1 hypothetical protein [Amaricoccus sp.]